MSLGILVYKLIMKTQFVSESVFFTFATANARELGAGTSRRNADGRTLFTLDTKMSDRMVYFVVVVDDFAATYEINVSGKDRKTFYNEPMMCQVSF